MNYKTIKPGTLIRFGGMLGTLFNKNTKYFCRIPTGAWLMVIDTRKRKTVNGHEHPNQFLTLYEKKLVWIFAEEIGRASCRERV